MSCVNKIHANMSLSNLKLNEKQDTDIREPQKYKVFIHNDDFTTMEFVVKIFKTIFFLDEQTSFNLMLQVHHSNKAAVGVYTYDVAMSKVRKATELARKEGFLLRFTVEQE
jgi:ATP-dependent Clp protease adaptor protein ClpS